MQDALNAITEALYGGVSAWDQYAEAARRALEANPSEEQQRQAAAILATSTSYADLRSKFEQLTPAQKTWASTNLKGLKQCLEGAIDYDDAIKDIAKDSSKMKADRLADLGKTWKNTSKIIESASKGGDEFNDVYAKSTKEAQKLSQAWGALNAIQRGSLTNTSDLTDAYNTIASATGLEADSLMSDLSPALWMLESDTAAAAGTIEYLANELVRTGAININNPSWQSDLAALGASADDTNGRIAALVTSLLQVAGSSLYLDGNTIKVNWGGGNYSPPSSRKSRGGGGGGGSGGGSSRNSNKNNGPTEIERMVDMMEQIQDLFEYHQSMLQEIQNIYSEKGELTNLIQVYKTERSAIKENNKVLEENVRRLEELLPAQQQLVASMDTGNENYEEASKDLERLQKAHQEYKKQLLSNQAAIDKLTKSIKEQKDAIRDMEIELENEVLQAIEDREERNQRILENTIDMEQEILDIIIARYERERDELIETAEGRLDLLSEESNLLSEQLAKRKELADEQDKQTKLQELENKLTRISADPTRMKEAQTLREQIADLRDEMAWDTAEKEVKAQQDAIEQQEKSLEEYIDYVEEYYDDLFEHPQQLIAEMKDVIKMTDDEIKGWLRANSEEYANATEASQRQMEAAWEDILLGMTGKTKTYWEEVKSIIAKGDKEIIKFLKENSEEFLTSSKKQQDKLLDNWTTLCSSIKSAYKKTYDEIQSYNYSAIPMPSFSGYSSGDSGGGGGGGGGGGKTTWYTSTASWYGYNSSEMQIASGEGASATSTSKSTAESTAKRNAKTAGNYAKNSNRNIVYISVGGVTTTSRAYKKGGLVDFTGPAWVDGTKSQPEAFLNAKQTQIIGDFAKALEKNVVNVPAFPSNPGYTGQSVASTMTIETINVNVDTLSDDADYDEVARRVGEAITEQMAKISAVGGIRITG